MAFDRKGEREREMHCGNCRTFGSCAFTIELLASIGALFKDGPPHKGLFDTLVFLIFSSYPLNVSFISNPCKQKSEVPIDNHLIFPLHFHCHLRPQWWLHTAGSICQFLFLNKSRHHTITHVSWRAHHRCVCCAINLILTRFVMIMCLLKNPWKKKEKPRI